jgi:hypothetical protein
MPSRLNDDFSDQAITEIDPDEAAINQYETDTIGLPDLPGKTSLSEAELNLADRPPLNDAPDSLTGAVMENLRVGAGAAPDTPNEDEVDDT